MENQILKLREQGMGYKKIGKTLGIGIDKVSSVLIENGITDHIQMPPEEMVEHLIYLYTVEQLGLKKIVKLMHISQTRLVSILRANQVQIGETAYHKNYEENVNHFYFDKIDSERKAYWLGLLYADGYNNEKFYQVEITLKSEDIALLQIFKEDLNNKYKIKTKEVICNGKTFSASRLTFYSKRLSQQLKNLGCMQNKSLVLQFPSLSIVPDDLLHHFMRGYFDGDGMISCIKDTYCSSTKFGITGNKAFVLEYENKLRKNVTISKATYYNQDGKAITWLHGGKNDAIKIYNWLYKDATIFLERKRNKFLEIKASIKKQNKLNLPS